MNINFTLVVQGLHFFIAYLLLRKLLFRLAITILDNEAHQKRSLQAAIETRTAALITKEQENRARWLSYQQEFKTLIPAVQDVEVIHREAMPTLTYPTVSQEEIKPLIHEVATSLVQKVHNVRG